MKEKIRQYAWLGFVIPAILILSWVGKLSFSAGATTKDVQINSSRIESCEVELQKVDQINTKVEIVCNDVKWIKRYLQKNGK